MGGISGLLRSNISDHEESPRDIFSKEAFIPTNRGNIHELYQVEPQLLGSGGYGNVFKAWDRETTCLRAIKSMPKRLKGGFAPELREIAIMKMIDHPNVVKLYEIFEDAKYVYLVMDYLEGGELFSKVASVGSFSEFQAATIMKQIFSGINYLHTMKIVHRDLKPENFIFRDDTQEIADNCIKIIDFGLSTMVRDGEMLTSVTGTPYFLAPEVLNHGYAYECDVWSAGVLLYILLCGYPPFRSTKKGHDEMFEFIKRGAYCFREQEWASISGDAKNLIRGMLTVDVTRRFTAHDCLQHVWIQQLAPNASKVQLPPAIIKRMDHFASLHKLKKMVLHALAMTLEDRQLADLRDIFHRLDTSGDGLLSVAELEVGLKDIGWMSFPHELDTIFRRTDSNGNGAIDYSEFIAATLDLKKCIREDELWAAFRIFDTNGDGKISVEEFKEFLSFEEGDLIVDEILALYDTNRDSGIDFNEFIKMMESFIEDREINGGLYTRSVPVNVVKLKRSLVRLRGTQSETLAKSSLGTNEDDRRKLSNEPCMVQCV